jgi:hypothetical protein
MFDEPVRGDGELRHPQHLRLPRQGRIDELDAADVGHLSRPRIGHGSEPVPDGGLEPVVHAHTDVHVCPARLAGGVGGSDGPQVPAVDVEEAGGVHLESRPGAGQADAVLQELRSPLCRDGRRGRRRRGRRPPSPPPTRSRRAATSPGTADGRGRPAARRSARASAPAGRRPRPRSTPPSDRPERLCPRSRRRPRPAAPEPRPAILPTHRRRPRVPYPGGAPDPAAADHAPRP